MLNKRYHHAKFDIYHIYSVRENRKVKVFATYGQSAGQLITDFSCESPPKTTTTTTKQQQPELLDE